MNKFTRYHRILNLVTVLILITTFLYLVLLWSTIPEKITGHYNSSELIAGEIKVNCGLLLL